MPYPFFLSYAGADQHRHLKTFIEELKTQVVGKVGLPEGFVDCEGINAGEDWAQTIGSALNESVVLVALWSPSYFASPYCGKELEFFLRRRRLFREKHKGSKEPGYLIPVLWQPCPELPVSHPEVQWEGPDRSKIEPAFGLFDSINAESPEYKEVARRVAVRIQSIFFGTRRKPLPPLNPVPQLHGLDSAFDPPRFPLPDMDDVKAGGSTSVTLVYPYPPEHRSWPYPPPIDRSALFCAAAIGKANDMVLQSIEFRPADSGFIERVAQACQRKSVVLVMFPGDLLADPQVLASVRRFDESKPDRVIPLIFWDGSSPGQFCRLAPNLCRHRFYGEFQTPDGLEAAIRDRIARLRDELDLANPGDPPIAGSAPSLPPGF